MITPKRMFSFYSMHKTCSAVDDCQSTNYISCSMSTLYNTNLLDVNTYIPARQIRLFFTFPVFEMIIQEMFVRNLCHTPITFFNISKAGKRIAPSYADFCVDDAIAELACTSLQKKHFFKTSR